MNARPLFLLLILPLLPLLPAAAVAQTSYNRWDARPADPIVPLPRKSSGPPATPKPAASVRALHDSVALTTGQYVQAQVMPTFPGGAQAMHALISKSLKRPAGPRQRGSVLVQFTVLASGAISGIGVVPGRGLNEAYDAVAMAAVSRLPAFTPGQRGGQPVDMVLTVPVEFR